MMSAEQKEIMMAILRELKEIKDYLRRIYTEI